MNALEAQDFIVLHLALDLLSKHTADEVSKTSKQNGTKHIAMLTMREQIANVRTKLQALERRQ